VGDERIWVERYPDGTILVSIHYVRRASVTTRWGVEEREWIEEQAFTHLPRDVERFRRLLARKHAREKVEVKDGVLAYLIVWNYGRKSVIAGFLWAMGDEYPGFRDVREEVEVEEPITTFDGRVVYQVVKRRIEKRAERPEDLAPIVGQCLSRLAREGIIGRVRY
jgi:hypothetical protein